jgi:hypothetical protein
LIGYLLQKNSTFNNKFMVTRFFRLSLALLLCATSLSAFAQKDDNKTKELKKKWKGIKDDMEVPAFKKMLDEREQFQGETEGLKRSLINMKTVVSEKDDEIRRLNEEIASLQAGMAKAGITEKNEVDGTKQTGGYAGIIYRVQVGAYSKTDFSQYGGNNPNFTVEKEGEVIRYILGHFIKLEEAKNFKTYLQNVGVKDAWVVGYKDNARLNAEEQAKLNN